MTADEFDSVLARLMSALGIEDGTDERSERCYAPYPRHPERPGAGRYLLRSEDAGWFWVWREGGEPDERSPQYESRADALRGVADDWDANGGEARPRFVGMLRGLATREDRRTP